MKNVFPPIVEKIPARDYGIEGLRVFVDHTPRGTVYFVHAEREIAFPEHAHAEQYTVVVSGECSLTMNGETHRYGKGDSYVIPGGTAHQLTLHAGYAEIDYVDDPADGT